ncbi:MAG: hypothetical protein IIW77_06090 [Bacteroidaceae bacterium]|nr:hypothetical protein [Bacteroidaceae bacterium]
MTGFTPLWKISAKITLLLQTAMETADIFPFLQLCGTAHIVVMDIFCIFAWFIRSCLKLYRQVFYRARIECLFIFKGRIAGYVTAKKKETGIIEHKKRRNYQLL